MVADTVDSDTGVLASVGANGSSSSSHCSKILFRVSPGLPCPRGDQVGDIVEMQACQGGIEDGNITAQTTVAKIRATLRGILFRFVRVAVVTTAIMGLTLFAARRMSVKSRDWSSLDFQSYQLSKVRARGLIPFDSDFAYNFVLDTHSHTLVSDGLLSPQQLVDYAVAEGLDGIAVTDHQTIRGSMLARDYAEREYPGQLVVLPGLEFTTCRVHLNLVGIQSSENVTPLLSAWPTDADIEAAVEATHAAGGIAIINHIPWSTSAHTGDGGGPRLRKHPNMSQLASMGVDAVEVTNQATFDLQSALFARRRGIMSIVGGSDVHTPSKGFYGFTALWINETSGSSTSEEKAVAAMTERRAGRTSVLFDAVGSPFSTNVPVTGLYKFVYPFLLVQAFLDSGLYTYVPGMYSFNGGFCSKSRITVNWLVASGVIFFVALCFAAFELVACAWRARGTMSQRCITYFRICGKSNMVVNCQRRKDKPSGDGECECSIGVEKSAATSAETFGRSAP